MTSNDIEARRVAIELAEDCQQKRKAEATPAVADPLPAATVPTNGTIPPGTKAIWRSGKDEGDLPITIKDAGIVVDGIRYYATEEFKGGTPETEIILDLPPGATVAINGNGHHSRLTKQERVERIRANVPKELQDLNQWVVWRTETRKDKPTKVPYNVNRAEEQRASSTDPKTWTSFQTATRAYLYGNYDGVGFVFHEDDPFAGVDFDKCIMGGVMDPLRAGWMKRLDSYSEDSQSGTGAHTIVIGELPPGGRKSTQHNVEMYDDGRFFVMTGDHIPGTPREINERDPQLKALHTEIFAKQEEPKKPSSNAQDTGGAIPTDDQELLRRMFASKNGNAIKALWDGSTTAHNDDDSAADQALCNHLAFWTGKDARRMDRMFRQSKLMRDKWDANARSGETYGEGTIARAITGTKEVYTPKATKDAGETTAKPEPPSDTKASALIEHGGR